MKLSDIKVKDINTLAYGIDRAIINYNDGRCHHIKMSERAYRQLEGLYEQYTRTVRNVSSTERLIIYYTKKGLKPKAIAEKLGITPKEVSTYKTLMKKRGVM